MISDLDIYRAAKLLVDKHGVEALIRAAMQADAMLDKGDMDGKAGWLVVVKASGSASERPEVEAKRTDWRHGRDGKV